MEVGWTRTCEDTEPNVMWKPEADKGGGVLANGTSRLQGNNRTAAAETEKGSNGDKPERQAACISLPWESKKYS